MKIKEQTTRTKHEDLKTKGNKNKEKENLKKDVRWKIISQKTDEKEKKMLTI